ILTASKKQEMLQPGDRVGVAVSSGADSVALLLLLLELRAQLGVVLSVIHFNHKLRGKASDADENFVARLIAKHGLEFHAASIEVAKKATKERANLEDAARRARKQTWREDATNRDTKRMRARIRKKLLPLLEKQFQPAIVKHLATLAELAREDEAFLDALAEARTVMLAQKKDGQVRIAVDD